MQANCHKWLRSPTDSAAIVALATALFTGGATWASTDAGQAVISGRVIDGAIANARVCLDVNGNGRCDADEPQVFSTVGGGYQLTIPQGSVAALVAEVIAGQSVDSDDGGAAAQKSYRMASPSSVYSTDITPYTTVVHLVADSDTALAEDLARTAMALPPRFALDASFATTPASAAAMTAREIASSLKSIGNALDLGTRRTLAPVIAALPTALTTLPQLRVTTKAGAPIDSREVSVDATFTLLDQRRSSQPIALNGKIRGRGNSTWPLPKKPYKIQFSNDSAYANLADVLGMTRQRNWVLFADYNDRTLMRNKLALTLAGSSLLRDGLKWTPSGQHVEVWVNGEYEGVYLIAEDIRIDPARLNIDKMGASDVDGGYIFQVDWRLDCYKDAKISLQYLTPLGMPVCIDTPDESSITTAQLAYAKGWLDTVESSIYAGRRLDRVNGASFVDWYLLNELFRNNDAAFFSSVYLWKDSDKAAIATDRLMNMGPAWDFDISAGNINYNDNWLVEGCWVSRPLPDATSWIAGLLDNPAFVNLALQRWKQNRRALEIFINRGIDAYAARLQLAEERNFVRWPTLGQPLTGYYTFPTYDAEVGYLRSFLNARMQWLDRAYANAESFRTLCKSASTAPSVPTGVKTVFVIVLENKDWSSIANSALAPYINRTLLPLGAHAEAYRTALDPSLPNYLVMEAGSNLGIVDNGEPAVHALDTAEHLVNQLEAAGISWKSYQEGISGTACPLQTAYPYAAKHNPFVYFKDVTGNNDPRSARCIAHIRPLSELEADLANDTLPRYVFITPDLCGGGHDACPPVSSPIVQADNWLRDHVPKILASNAYRTGGALFVTWDEPETRGAPIGMILLSPFAKSAYSNAILYSHASLLRTVQEIFGVSPFLRNAASATSLADLFFRSSPAATGTVVEYFNPDLDHYFITADAAEQGNVDRGAAGRWQRTGATFKVGGASSACRFYGNAASNPDTGRAYGPNSHFFTADERECNVLRSGFDPSAKSWRFEADAFLTTRAQAGGCASTLQPIYRAYNNGFARNADSNHRISPNLADIQSVVARGWKDEGVVMCAPR